jgi:hypothetical protein
MTYGGILMIWRALAVHVVDRHRPLRAELVLMTRAGVPAPV